MAKRLSHMESRRMYSWWWDSHISPKNSKWLQENLTDMDSKVKSMIKLIEEDADSFARRAEMYYKKRPELMKMVEEFYRAYRALAERYDHATGVIRHAHRSMSEAQLPMTFADDSPVIISVSETDPRTPEISNYIKIGEFTDDSDSVIRRPVERVRRGLNFDKVEEKGEDSIRLNQTSESKDVQSLKESIAKLESEKESDLIKYQQSLDKLSQLENEISKTREDFSVLTDHANKAENEVIVLREMLTNLETEKESKLQDYNQCLEKISNLQTIETEAEFLKDELDKLAVEKDISLDRYMQSLEIISNLENELRLTEEDAKKLKEKAEKAEREVEILRQTISKLSEELEAASVQYQKCLDTISTLEHKLTCAYDEIDNRVSKLKGSEEKCLLLEKSNQSLNSELESLTLEMGSQAQDLTEKQKELGRLWASIQEERLRFLEAETGFQTLQHLHAQTQEELRAMASELDNRAQLINIAETQNRSLQDEVVKVKQENKHLDELNASSSLSMKDMQNEIRSLKESKGKLEDEVELRLDQRNALQREIYCLREEINDVNMKHVSVLDQVHAVGLKPESFRSSVKKLQEENSSLKENFTRESSEKAALLEKLVIFDQLLEKNSLLETSLSNLNGELEAVRGKIEALEQSCQSLLKEKYSLMDEKTALVLQLHETNKNLNKLSENNTVLVNSLTNAHRQLEALRAKSRILEDSCQLLVNEKADLITEKDGLTFQLEKTKGKLENLGKICSELEGRCVAMEKEKKSTLRKVEELQMSLEVQRQNYDSYVETSEAWLSGVESEKRFLQEELDQVLDNAIENEIEIFVFRITAQEIKENNSFLHITNRKLLYESSLLEQKISVLERENLDQQVEIKSLSDQASCLRAGMHQLLKALDIVEDHACKDKTEQDEVYFKRLLSKLQTMKSSICKSREENLQSSIELSVLVTWIRQLSQDNDSLSKENNFLSEANKKVEIELQEKINEINDLETRGISVFGQLQYFMASQLLYEHKFHELKDQNDGLQIQLAAFGPEITSLKECISSLENHTDLHIKFQNPEIEGLQDAQVTKDPHKNISNEDKKASMPSTFSDLRDLRIRLQAIAKAAVEVKEQMVQDNINLHSKLDASIRQLELLQSESGRYRRNPKPTSEITEADSALLTKDIVLDQISDGSSYGFSKRQPVDNRNFEIWETSDLDRNLALTLRKSKKLISPRVKTTIKKQKSGFSTSDGLIEKELSVDKLEISKRSTESFQEGSKRKILERLDSDVQKLANLQITVQDLKRKLEVTEKGKRGKAVIECEALKRQLEEADIAIMKLFDLNVRLMKNIEDNEKTSFSNPKSSFDLEGDVGPRRRRISEQARRMSEKIGRLQLEIQKIQFVLMKLDEEERGKSTMSESKRRVLLRDYLYGGVRKGQSRKKAQFCACSQPSTVED